MKITHKVLYQRVKGALSEALHLDLSGLGIGAIESLELCPKLESLDLSRNCLEEAENFECCKNLWRINLSDNKITCLGTLSKMFAIGTLDLSNNDLSWSELLRIRHVFILDLHLHGNENLESDIFYRLHVIDCLPNVWMLDGRLITCAERLQVQHFFHESALSSRPVRHKLSEKSYAYFKPSKSTEIHGCRTRRFSITFPIQELHNSDTDRRRLEFLAYNIQEDLKNKKKSMKRPSSWISNNCLKTIVESRHADREKCNMLLLLLVASLEFDLPEKLISETLSIAKLNPLFGTNPEQLFHLDPSSRTEVISLLVSSCKLDRETNKNANGGLYDRLYLCLYHSVAHLLHKTSKAKRKGWFDKSSKSSRPNTGVSHYRHMIDTKAAAFKKQLVEWKAHQTLLASELVLLLSVVPSFYQLIVSKDTSVYTVVSLATGDEDFYEKLTCWSEKLMTEGGDTNALCREICKSVVKRIEQATDGKKKSRTSSLARQTQAAQTNLILKASDAYPKRPKSAVLLSGERLTQAKRFEKQTEFINMVRPYDMQHLSLGSFVLLGPQNLAKVVALPEPHIALVQMDLIPSLNGSVKVFTKDQDEHYCYVDIRKLTYDHAGHYWKPRGAVGDKVTLQLDDEIVISSIAEEKALKRERSRLMSKSITARPVYSAGAKKQAMLRPASPLLAQRLSPVNSITFISRDQSRIDNEDSDAYQPTPRPLSTMYCERMELTLSDISFGTDNSYSCNEPFRSVDLANKNRGYEPAFVTEAIQDPSPNFIESEPSGINNALSQNEGRTAVWDEKADCQVDSFLENQSKNSQASGATEESLFAGEKQNEQVPNAERVYEIPEANLEASEDPDASAESTPLVSFRIPEQTQEVSQESTEEVMYEDKAKLERQLQSTNLEDEEEPELQKLLLDEVVEPSESIPHQLDFERLQNGSNQSSTRDIHVEKMKLITKLSSRKWFSISGETMPLKERPASEKKPRVKSAAEAKPKSKFYDPSSRPASAIITAKKVLFLHKELTQDESRPGSASSFQMMRTEAWRSSASSASTGFPTSSTDALKYTQFAVNEQLNKNSKVKFGMRIKRPPPQRPTSPDHDSTRAEEDSLQTSASYAAPPKLTLTDNILQTSHSERLSTSRWLAQGRNVHLEDVQSRQQLSAQKPPGYLDGLYLPPNLMKKRKFISKAAVGIDMLPARPVKPSAMHPYTYHRRATPSDQLPRSASLPITRSISWSRPRFSTLSDIKCISSLPPSRTSIHKQLNR